MKIDNNPLFAKIDEVRRETERAARTPDAGQISGKKTETVQGLSIFSAEYLTNQKKLAQSQTNLSFLQKLHAQAKSSDGLQNQIANPPQGVNSDLSGLAAKTGNLEELKKAIEQMISSETSLLQALEAEDEKLTASMTSSSGGILNDLEKAIGELKGRKPGSGLQPESVLRLLR